MINVIGYGSLLSEQSARETIPKLWGFKLVTVPNYMRIFNKVGIVFFQRYGLDENDKEISSCATRAAPGIEMICSLFQCVESDFKALYEREHRFRWINVQCNNGGRTEIGRMCTEYNDQDYFLNKCVTPLEYERRVGQFYGGKIWRDDILPFPRYLRQCLKAAREHGQAVYRNFMETSFLADGKTSIRAYVGRRPELLSPNIGSSGDHANEIYDFATKS